MELSKTDTKHLKGIAILLMVLLHLFARKDVNGLYETLFTINDVPLVYYIGLVGDACRPIYLFVTGYAFYIIMNKSNEAVITNNIKRILKLFINYWIVFLIFVPIGFLIGREQIFSPDITKLILNFVGLSNSYNGAWWFLQVYIIFLLLSPILIKVVAKYNLVTLFLISGAIYFVCYVQRFKNIIDFGDYPLSVEVIRILVLLGTSQLSFILGSLFAKEKIFTKLYCKFHNIKFKNTFCLLGLVSIIGFHGIIESAIIAPINGISIICLYMMIDKNVILQKTLDFISDHSTNIWLTHMFFYSTIFTKVVFAPKYPLFIFIWLILLCIFSSYIIKALTKPILLLVDKKKTNKKNDRQEARVSNI